MVLLSSRKMAFALEMSRLRDPQKVCQKIVFCLFIVISVPILFGLVENSKWIAAKSEDIMRGLLLGWNYDMRRPIKIRAPILYLGYCWMDSRMLLKPTLEMFL